MTDPFAPPAREPDDGEPPTTPAPVAEPVTPEPVTPEPGDQAEPVQRTRFADPAPEPAPDAPVIHGTGPAASDPLSGSAGSVDHEGVVGDQPGVPLAAPPSAPQPTLLEADPAAAELASDVAALETTPLKTTPLDTTALQGTAPTGDHQPGPAAEAAVAEAPVAGDAPPAVRRGVLVPVLAALVVVLAGLAGFLGWQAQRTAGAAPVEKSRTEALASARDAARLVFSYDYRTLAKDFAAGKAVTTGEFAKEYARTTSKLVDDVAPRYKAVVSADVSEASVVRASEDQVVCLVFVNQVSTSSLMPNRKVTQSRLEMTLTRSGDRWLVAKIDAL